MTLLKIFRKNIVKGILILLFCIGLFCIYSFLSGFWGEKGKQSAMPTTTDNGTEAVIKEENSSKVAEKNMPQINQHTEGDQSPSVAGDNIIIEYNKDKDKNSKE